jgi:hypothetical protein
VREHDPEIGSVTPDGYDVAAEPGFGIDDRRQGEEDASGGDLSRRKRGRRERRELNEEPASAQPALPPPSTRALAISPRGAVAIVRAAIGAILRSRRECAWSAEGELSLGCGFA